ncbi:MAG: hypothetical protein CMI26_06915 [Opitutae bacterium]|nr:hypothetical protein [Opitutae bacterium]
MSETASDTPVIDPHHLPNHNHADVAAVAQAGASLLQHAAQNMMREHILSDDHKRLVQDQVATHHAKHVDKHLSDLLIASTMVLVVVICMICMIYVCCFSRYVSTGGPRCWCCHWLLSPGLPCMCCWWRRTGGAEDDCNNERGSSGGSWAGKGGGTHVAYSALGSGGGGGGHQQRGVLPKFRV